MTIVICKSTYKKAKIIEEERVLIKLVYPLINTEFHSVAATKNMLKARSKAGFQCASAYFLYQPVNFIHRRFARNLTLSN